MRVTEPDAHGADTAREEVLIVGPTETPPPPPTVCVSTCQDIVFPALLSLEDERALLMMSFGFNKQETQMMLEKQYWTEIHFSEVKLEIPTGMFCLFSLLQRCPCVFSDLIAAAVPCSVLSMFLVRNVLLTYAQWHKRRAVCQHQPRVDSRRLAIVRASGRYVHVVSF